MAEVKYIYRTFGYRDMKNITNIAKSICFHRSLYITPDFFSLSESGAYG